MIVNFYLQNLMFGISNEHDVKEIMKPTCAVILSENMFHWKRNPSF